MAPFFETQSQAWVFLGMVYLGLGLGIVYDGFGLVRRSGNKGWIIGTDLLFFLLAGASLTLALVITGQDELRIYALLGLVCGGLIYMLGLRRLITGIISVFKKRIAGPLKQAAARAKERKERKKSAREGRKQA
jgi:hypothetical protein